MENASKALIMAGSVLLAILIIGSLVFMFNTLSELKNTEASAEDVEQLAKYNRQIETFNRSGLYGSEIMSLANLIDDYNKRQADLKGYTAITLEVVTNGIAGVDNPTMQATYTEENGGYAELIEDFNQLQDDVDDIKKDVLYGQTIEKLAGMRTEEIVDALRNYGVQENQIQTIIKKKIEPETLNYTNKKSELTEFKNKQFGMPIVEYDQNNGRITKMSFTEILPN